MWQQAAQLLSDQQQQACASLEGPQQPSGQRSPHQANVPTGAAMDRYVLVCVRETPTSESLAAPPEPSNTSASTGVASTGLVCWKGATSMPTAMQHTAGLSSHRHCPDVHAGAPTCALYVHVHDGGILRVQGQSRWAMLVGLRLATGGATRGMWQAARSCGLHIPSAACPRSPNSSPPGNGGS